MFDFIVFIVLAPRRRARGGPEEGPMILLPNWDPAVLFLSRISLVSIVGSIGGGISYSGRGYFGTLSSPQ